MKSLTIHERMNKFLEGKNLSMRDINKKMGKVNGHVNKILNGQIRPSTDIVESFLRAFPELNRQWLYFGEGQMVVSQAYSEKSLENLSARDAASEYSGKNAKRDVDLNVYPNVYPPQEDNSTSKKGYTNFQPNVYFVDARAAAGLPASIQAGESIEEMPSGYLPFLGNTGQFIAIQVTGDSMFPTIADRDWLIASRIYEVTNLRQGLVYLIITSDGVVAKRFGGVSSGKSGLILRSDNHDYQAYTIKGTEALQIWEVSHILSSDLSLDPAHRLDLVDRHLLDLKDRVRNLEKLHLKQL